MEELGKEVRAKVHTLLYGYQKMKFCGTVSLSKNAERKVRIKPAKKFQQNRKVILYSVQYRGQIESEDRKVMQGNIETDDRKDGNRRYIRQVRKPG